MCFENDLTFKITLTEKWSRDKSTYSIDNKVSPGVKSFDYKIIQTALTCNLIKNYGGFVLFLS